jgi:hypothetical protein
MHVMLDCEYMCSMFVVVHGLQDGLAQMWWTGSMVCLLPHVYLCCRVAGLSHWQTAQQHWQPGTEQGASWWAT